MGHACGAVQYYDQIYPAVINYINITNAMNYTSPVMHTVVLADLEPNMTYYYQVGDGSTMSETFSFRSLAATGTPFEPLSLSGHADTCSNCLACLVCSIHLCGCIYLAF